MDDKVSDSWDFLPLVLTIIKNNNLDTCNFMPNKIIGRKREIKIFFLVKLSKMMMATANDMTFYYCPKCNIYLDRSHVFCSINKSLLINHESYYCGEDNNWHCQKCNTGLFTVCKLCHEIIHKNAELVSFLHLLHAEKKHQIKCRERTPDMFIINFTYIYALLETTLRIRKSQIMPGFDPLSRGEIYVKTIFSNMPVSKAIKMVTKMLIILYESNEIDKEIFDKFLNRLNELKQLIILDAV